MSAKGFEGSSNEVCFWCVLCFQLDKRGSSLFGVFFVWSPIHVFPQKLALLILEKTLEISFISHTIHVHLLTGHLVDLYGKW